MRGDTPPICDYEGSDYQTTFWDQGGRRYEDQVEAIALGRLLPPGGERLLEVGAGAGRNTPRYNGFQQVVLLDYSRTQLQQARARLGGGGRYLYVAADAYHLPFVPGSFDAATMIRVLHHMADAPRVLSQARQALQPGGAFILEFANKQNLKAILRYLLRRQTWSPFSPQPVEFAPLNFDFHPRTVRRWLQERGFHIQRQLTVSHFRVGGLKRVAPLKLLVGLDALAQLTGNWWQLSPSVFILANAAGQASAKGQAGAEGQSTVAPVERIFRCPACEHAPLKESRQGVACPACGRSFPVVEDIYDFRDVH